MKSFRLAVFLGVFLALAVTCAGAQAADPADQVKRIQKAYEGITDIRGTFIQKSTIRDLNRTDVYRGEFFIKPPMKMKLVYAGSASQDIVINKDHMLILKKGERQAYRMRFDRQTYGQTPVALLGGFGKIGEEFTATGTGDALVLKPKKPTGNITSLRIILSDEGFPIRAFTIHDSRSNVIEIELKDVSVNTGIRDSLFDLSVPKGFSVYDQGL
ncbi:MAG: outer membrane lipoprotein carrier protein LolA [Nitrospiraceae bacterium]|nr:outer membrane lipoprotein carrier protein LolA [Nitrospiraceae bacterium]